MKTNAKKLFLLPVLLAALGLLPAGRALARTFTVLHNFTGNFEPSANSDGCDPVDNLILAGNILYGTASAGGTNNSGTVFKVNTDGTGFTDLYSFTGGNDGGNPMAGLILSGNTLYGTVENGGTNGFGAVFEINTDGTGFTNLYSFTGGNDGAKPVAGLVLSGNTLYGTVEKGGTNGFGAVFEINTDGTCFTNLYSFAGLDSNPNDGFYPMGGLVLSGVTLYGTASQGGSMSFGTVFAINTDGTGYTNIYNFGGFTDGGNPQASLIISGNTLYGTASFGGLFFGGSVFAVNTDGSDFTSVYGFTGGSDGGNPEGSLILSGNTLYGTTASGGTNGLGAVFRVNTDTTGFTNLYSFTGANTFTGASDGSQPVAGLVLSGNTLYGTTEFGGNTDVNGSTTYGTLFGVNTDGSSYTNLYSFSTFTPDGDGAYPAAGLILSGNTIYGTCSAGGGTNFHGMVFAVNTDGTGYTNLHSFGGNLNGIYDGNTPLGGLLLSGNTLYGTTEFGGVGAGNLFALNTDDTGFTNFYSFAGGDDGGNPVAGLILSSNILYGTTIHGGYTDYGVVFAVSTNGTGLTSLHQFSVTSDGALPNAGLVLAGNILYGTAPGGGTNGEGTVFAVNPLSVAFTNVHNFAATGDGPLATYTNAEGAGPSGTLILAGNTLYGTAEYGGTSGYGAVFKMNTDGSGFTNLHSFTFRGTDGAHPLSGLILSGNTLYGTARQGGFYDVHGQSYGIVFAVNTDGSGFTNLYSFTGGSDGGNPVASLLLAGNTLYGTAEYGGTNGFGTVFSLSLGPIIRPQLVINQFGTNVVLSWAASATGFTLQSATNLKPPVAWNTVSPEPVIVSTSNVVTNAISGAWNFYRLIK